MEYSPVEGRPPAPAGTAQTDAAHLAPYGLQELPFRRAPDPRFVWLGEPYRSAFAALGSAILGRGGCLLLTGDAGTGKTALVKAVVRSLGTRVQVVEVPYPSLDTLDFFQVIAAACDLEADLGALPAFLGRFGDFLSAAAGQGRRVLLVIEEAQSVNEARWAEISQLAALGEERGDALQILLVSQNAAKVAMAAGQRWGRDRIAVQCHLRPLGEAETAAYVRHRLAVAGGSADLFEADGARALFKATGGVPRLLNLVADAALARGASRGLPTIGAGLVEESAEALGLSGESGADESSRVGARHPEHRHSPLGVGVESDEPDLQWSAILAWKRARARRSHRVKVAGVAAVVLLAAGAGAVYYGTRPRASTSGSPSVAANPAARDADRRGTPSPPADDATARGSSKQTRRHARSATEGRTPGQADAAAGWGAPTAPPPAIARAGVAARSPAATPPLGPIGREATPRLKPPPPQDSGELTSAPAPAVLALPPASDIPTPHAAAPPARPRRSLASDEASTADPAGIIDWLLQEGRGSAR